MTMAGASAPGPMLAPLHGTEAHSIIGALAVTFVLTALRWLLTAMDPEEPASATASGKTGVARSHTAYDLGCHAAMAFGMAIMLVTMA